MSASFKHRNCQWCTRCQGWRSPTRGALLGPKPQVGMLSVSEPSNKRTSRRKARHWARSPVKVSLSSGLAPSMKGALSGLRAQRRKTRHGLDPSKEKYIIETGARRWKECCRAQRPVQEGMFLGAEPGYF